MKGLVPQRPEEGVLVLQVSWRHLHLWRCRFIAERDENNCGALG